MTGRALFLLIAAVVAAVVLFTAVVRPGVERGGFAEILAVGAVVLGVLLAERWLRAR